MEHPGCVSLAQQHEMNLDQIVISIFLVQMETNRSLLDHVALMQDLEDLLGRKVDIVPEEGLHEMVRDQVLKEAIPL
jgi:predicted nucleotidyltransferase